LYGKEELEVWEDIEVLFNDRDRGEICNLALTNLDEYSEDCVHVCYGNSH